MYNLTQTIEIGYFTDSYEDKMIRPTLKTIAEEMNLSVGAISRIINGKGKDIGLNDHTIASTLVFARKIGYHPHKQAQSLRLGKTNTIGVILCLPEPNNSDLIYRLFKGIAQAARKKSQVLMFFDIDDTASALAALDQCLTARVDGIIATNRNDPVYLERLQELINQGTNIVTVLNRRDDNLLNCPSIIVDHEQGGFIATEYLIKKGYRKIAHLANSFHGIVGIEHFKGYKRALDTFNIPYNENLVTEDNEHNQFTGAKSLLCGSELPDAVFCWNDKSAVAAKRIFKEANVKIEVVGFDNREFIQYLEEPFSSVDYPLMKVGEKAIETLLSGDLSRRILLINPEFAEHIQNNRITNIKPN
ncbi:MAG: LacI family DNA-binding transcriptional regulator [Lentisphaerota bacterium]